MVEKQVGAFSKNSAALPVTGSLTFFYDLQTYHASHYGRKKCRGNVKNSGALPPTVADFLATTSKPTTLAIMVEKQVGLLFKNSAALPLTGCRTLIYDLQTYHARHYGRKSSRGIFKKFSSTTSYGQLNFFLRPPNLPR